MSADVTKPPEPPMTPQKEVGERMPSNAPEDPEVVNPISHGPVDPPETLPEDDALRTAVIAALDADGRIEGTIDTRASAGVITLTGQVPSEFQRSLVDAAVGTVPGVLVVENQLDVADMGPRGLKSE